MTTTAAGIQELLEAVRARVESAGVFGPVAVRDGRLVCHARASAEPASYRLEADGAALWVSLVTANRWLSESIEADLMHSGDKVEDLIEEELVELGVRGGPIRCEHFRSDDMLFTFRTPVPIPPDRPRDPASVQTAAAYLLAYEAAFRNLGDMDVAGGT